MGEKYIVMHQIQNCSLSKTQWKSKKATQTAEVNLPKIHPTKDRDPKYIDSSYKSLSLKKQMTQVKKKKWSKHINK